MRGAIVPRARRHNSGTLGDGAPAWRRGGGRGSRNNRRTWRDIAGVSACVSHGGGGGVSAPTANRHGIAKRRGERALEGSHDAIESAGFRGRRRLGAGGSEG